MLKILCWNINSIRSRIFHLISVIQNENPDIILLQEIKCQFEQFPFLKIEDIGYKAYILSQKSYNGVAILSKYNCEDIIYGIPDFVDENARYIEAFVSLPNGLGVRVASVYVPNGQSVDSEKYDYKLAFLDALNQRMRHLSKLDEALIIGGDYNVAFDVIDVYDADKLKNSIGFHYLERNKLQSLVNNGFKDAFRIKNPYDSGFTWWDYRKNSVENDLGMRIDFFLINPKCMDLVDKIEVLKNYRTQEKPSDHAPIMATFYN